MPRVYCADLTCEFCNDKGLCTQKTIDLSMHVVHTMWEGVQSFQKCKNYQESNEYIVMQKFIAKTMGKEKQNE